ncbi:MAG: 30S ribosome-binding factor RbfA [Clostridiales bacterium]|nr:30S ribosome-binding factor RbfA [Clostridiales bacterium]
MSASRRQERVGSLIKGILGRVLIQDIQDSSSGLITVTRVEMSADLKTAYVYLSSYGQVDKEALLAGLDKRKGYLRKTIASAIKLKYNPSLIFALDQTAEYESLIDELLSQIKKHEK